MKKFLTRVKKTVALTITGSLLATSIPITASAAKFSDTQGHWATSAVDTWSNYEIITGYEDGSFRPGREITRAEFATIVDRIMQYQTESTAVFSDVNADTDWFAGNISRLNAAGIMNGVGENLINPNGKITRQEAFVLLARMFSIEPNAEGLLNFADSHLIGIESNCKCFNVNCGEC